MTGLWLMALAGGAALLNQAGGDDSILGQILYVWPDGGHVTRVRHGDALAVDSESLGMPMAVDFQHEIALSYRDWGGTKLVVVLLRLTDGVALMSISGPIEGEVDAVAEERLATFLSAMMGVTNFVNFDASTALLSEVGRSSLGREQIREGRWVVEPAQAAA